MSTPPLGIGIITYSRLAKLQQCLKDVETYTQAPYNLVIADDGSHDTTVTWAREAGYRVITGARKGCAWNKNRALYYFMEYTDCDPIVLLEDDTFPNCEGWEQRWIRAAQLWHHVNYCAGDPTQSSETPEHPLGIRGFSGQCTITTRAGLEQVGYLDARFVGYGEEHVEWTHRYRWFYEREWNIAPGTVPCLMKGVTVDWSHTWFNERELRYNERVHRMARAYPLYRAPWHTQDDRTTLENEMSQSGDAMLLPR